MGVDRPTVAQNMLRLPALLSLFALLLIYIETAMVDHNLIVSKFREVAKDIHYQSIILKCILENFFCSKGVILILFIVAAGSGPILVRREAVAVL